MKAISLTTTVTLMLACGSIYVNAQDLPKSDSFKTILQETFDEALAKPTWELSFSGDAFVGRCDAVFVSAPSSLMLKDSTSPTVPSWEPMARLKFPIQESEVRVSFDFRIVSGTTGFMVKLGKTINGTITPRCMIGLAEGCISSATGPGTQKTIPTRISPDSWHRISIAAQQTSRPHDQATLMIDGKKYDIPVINGEINECDALSLYLDGHSDGVAYVDNLLIESREAIDGQKRN